MKIVSITEILECNEWIRGKDLEFKIHLRDACGKQSCWIESLNDKNGSGQWEELYKALEEFFSRLRFRLEYGENRKDFWLL
ncbi:RDAC family protein [Lacrimispora brassicae]